MKTGPKKEPLEYAFMAGLVGMAGFVILDVCWFSMSHGAGSRNIVSQLLGMPILAFGGAFLFTLSTLILNRPMSDTDPVRIRKSPHGRKGQPRP